MTDNDSRVIGELVGRLDTFMDSYERDRKESREKIDKIFLKLDLIGTEGCPVGKSNAAAIKKLQAVPMAIVSVTAAVLSAIGAFVASWKH